MSAIAIGLVVFALVFGSALLAMFAHSRLPEDHLSSDSKDVVKLGVALIATMSALVLSLLISSAKTAVACAIFLIIELDRSFEGLLQVSGAPLRAALAQLGR